MRTVIHEVVADIDDEASEIVLLIHWIGGVHTELRLPKRRRGQRNSTSADIIAAVRQLVLIANDDLIAGILNRNGLVTGHGNRWTRERVTALRSHHKIPVFRPAADGIEPWLNLNKAARLLGVAPKTLRIAAEAGEIEGVHPSTGWSVDLQPIDTWRTGRPAYRSPRQAEPQIPRGIAPRSAKSDERWRNGRERPAGEGGAADAGALHRHRQGKPAGGRENGILWRRRAASMAPPG